MAPTIPRILRVQIRNYKSLADVNVDLTPLTLLVGPNGSGKSNFIDALAFVQQCLVDSIELAFKSRGGIGAVRRRSGGHPTHIGIRLSLRLDADTYADYAFEVAAKPRERFRVAHERCIVSHSAGPRHHFELADGSFTKSIPGIRPQVAPDRLALFAASATEEFRPVYDFLTAMHIYSISPQRLRELQEPDSGDVLTPDGSNAAAVLNRLEESGANGRYERVCRLLARAVEGIRKVEYHTIGQMETVQFRQDIGLKDPWKFDALNMSDGTLRLLGLLLAVFQSGRTSVVGVEEPEATVHPAIADLVIEVLLHASCERQVLVTTHSPDLLEFKSVSDSQIRAVKMEDGKTMIASPGPASRGAIRDALYSAGELLRNGELEPDLEAARSAAKELRVFGPLFLEETLDAADDPPDR